jgi:DNA-binding transcriptional ArsR family regulator
MPFKRPSRSRASSSQRLQNARDVLFTATANAQMNNVRGAICEPTRTQIVRLLSAGPLSVGELASVLERSKSATSQHLRVLREVGTVAPHRRGRAIIYSLTTTPLVEATIQLLDLAAGVAAA